MAGFPRLGGMKKDAEICPEALGFMRPKWLTCDRFNGMDREAETKGRRR